MDATGERRRQFITSAFAPYDHSKEAIQQMSVKIDFRVQIIVIQLVIVNTKSTIRRKTYVKKVL